MSKKQFTLDSWLKDKSQKVVTRCGFPVRIVCTDVKRKDYPILALVERDDQEEYQSFTKDGRFSLYNPLHDNFDLFIETADEVSEGEKIRKGLVRLLKELLELGGVSEDEWDRNECEKYIAWLEKQGQVNESTISQHENKMCKENDDSLTSEDEKVRKALLEMVHDTTGDELLVDYHVHKEEALDWLERQGEHAYFLSKIQVGDKVTRNEDGVLVNLSQLKRVAKTREKQGEQKPLGYVHHIDEDGYYTKEAILEPNPYTGTGFDYNGHHWGMCARDGGVEILMDGNITSRVFPDKNNIIEQKPADSYCQENCKGFQETGKCFADGECKAKREAEQNLAENAPVSTPMSYGKELEKRMCEACNRFFAPNTDSNRYSASDLFYAGVKAERDLNTLAWSEEDERNLQGVIDEIEANKNQAPDYDLATYDRFLSWLKSLKGRVQPKVELTQLDKNILEATIAFVEQNNHFNYWGGVDKQTVLSALRSLRPQK